MRCQVLTGDLAGTLPRQEGGQQQRHALPRLAAPLCECRLLRDLHRCWGQEVPDAMVGDRGRHSGAQGGGHELAVRNYFSIVSD